jgi:hypothetical protein
VTAFSKQPRMHGGRGLLNLRVGLAVIAGPVTVTTGNSAGVGGGVNSSSSFGAFASVAAPSISTRVTKMIVEILIMMGMGQICMIR